jgi:hypothetical protein
MATTQQASEGKKPPTNPTGKGGFGDNPENRNPGGWKKENTISYQYNRFMNMTPDELVKWSKTPNSERTVAMDLAYHRVIEAKKSLADVKEITDRTEGKAPQSIDVTSKGKELQGIIVEFVGEDDEHDRARENSQNTSTPTVS